MTNEELIKGLYCIRAIIETYKEDYPMQTENQLKVIDEIMTKADFIQGNIIKILESIQEDINELLEVEEDEEEKVFNAGLRCAVKIIGKYIDSAKEI